MRFAFQCMINPVVLARSEVESYQEEYCLSMKRELGLPGYVVERANWVEAEFFTFERDGFAGKGVEEVLEDIERGERQRCW